jgi:hypothetical protein
MSTDANVDVVSLFEAALSQNIDWKQWSDWIPTQIQELTKKN